MISPPDAFPALSPPVPAFLCHCQTHVDTRPLVLSAANHARAFLPDFNPRDLSSLVLSLAKAGLRDDGFMALVADEVSDSTTGKGPSLSLSD